MSVLALFSMGIAHAQSAAPTDTPNSRALDAVNVTARRSRELVQRVEKFVGQVAALENDENVPRWKAPVCPLVDGLSQSEGEFVLGRISEVARTAGIALAGEHCHPNLYIIVSQDPQRLLENTTEANLLVMFGSVGPTVIKEFIATARPVRVWYKTSMESSLGLPMGDTNPVPPPSDFAPRTVSQSNTSAHITTNVVYNLSTVVAVVDRARLKGLSQGQFADYIAMVGLADVKPGVQLGDAPTILRLFDGTPQDAPAGMSTWDQAFLKSLYETQHNSRLQRKAIARTIVRDITQ